MKPEEVLWTPKVRKVHMTFVGYGWKTVYELKQCDMDVSNEPLSFMAYAEKGKEAVIIRKVIVRGELNKVVHNDAWWKRASHKIKWYCWRKWKV